MIEDMPTTRRGRQEWVLARAVMLVSRIMGSDPQEDRNKQTDIHTFRWPLFKFKIEAQFTEGMMVTKWGMQGYKNEPVFPTLYTLLSEICEALLVSQK